MKDWSAQANFAVTLIDREGRVVEMNDRAAQAYAEDGGRKLYGYNSLDCHPPEARELLEALLQSQGTHVYSIEKAGKKTLIYQAPWYEDGEYAGMVELQIALPENMPHFIRSTS